MFLNPQFTSKTRLVLLLVLALSPLAYLVGAWLNFKHDPNSRAGIAIDRQTAIDRAAAYARSLGVEPSEWSTVCVAEPNNDLHFYYALNESHPHVDLARSVASAIPVRVRFSAPSGGEQLEVRLAPDGRVLGYTHTFPPAREFSDAGEAAARSIAVKEFGALPFGERLALFGQPAVSEERNFSGVKRNFTWHSDKNAMPNFDLSVAVSVLGDQVARREIKGDVADEYAAENFISHQQATNVLVFISLLFIIAVFLYGAYRYIARTLQKEVPHARSILLSLAVTGVYLLVHLLTDSAAVQINNTERVPSLVVWLIVLFFIGVTYSVYGLLLGLAYGSSEGDVREAYPGKLTSLDALITGKLFSKNVAQAVCIGAGIGGWFLLLSSLALLPWRSRPDAGQGLSNGLYQMISGRGVWLLPFVFAPLSSITAAISGLLIPLAFLHRYVRSTKLIAAALVIAIVVANLHLLAFSPLVLPAGILYAGVIGSVLIASFFAFDLLTVIAGYTAFSFASFVIFLTAQPAATLRQAGFVAFGIALVTIAIEVVFLFKGREYDEDEVRPRYARNLFERVRLQAEVSSAREAQIRLTPQSLPEMPGVSLAAACRPARVVGGDFYDVFKLDEHKLGIFVAEGHERGIEAALTIAFAKGFLMPRLNNGYTPSEIICDMQTQMAKMLDRTQSLHVAYAVIDTRTRTLTYARTGQHPQLTLKRNPDVSDNAAALVPLEMQERETRVVDGASTSPVQADEADCAIREATLPLVKDDVVLFYTDGIAKSLRVDGSPGEVMTKLFGVKSLKKNDALQTELDAALRRCEKQVRKLKLEDDLTAVVVRIDAPENTNE